MKPILLIMGCARSGSTLLYQYLCASQIFTYPTNFLSRFYYAPYLGALLQKMLFESDFNNEISVDGSDTRFISHLGKTKGPLSPHEFWYFWRRFFNFVDIQVLDATNLESVDAHHFLKELQAFQSVKDLPLVLKGMILNWHIPYLAGISDNFYFLSIKRELLANARSLIRARIDYFGDDQEWYSFKPPGTGGIRHLAPIHQATWQVLETNAAIDSGLAGLPNDRKFEVSYEDFCQEPFSIIEDICSRFGLSIPQAAQELPKAFEIKGACDSGKHRLEAIVQSLKPYRFGK